MSDVTPNLLLDCDPGHDDAVAIVAAARYANLIGITTVAGNAPLEQTTYNARVIRDLLAIDVPVHSGCAEAIVEPHQPAHFVHGKSGLDGAELPEPTTPLDGVDAIEFIVESCRATEGIWLVITGPQTNVALALRSAPDIGERIAGISFMGGGTIGNRTPAAEFNIWADPEAAQIVCEAGVPLKMAGLDVTYQFMTTPARIDAIKQLPGRLAEVLADLFEFFAANYLQRHDDGTVSGAAVHDPLAVLALTHPDLFTSTPRFVDVETRGRLTRGMTVVDRRVITDRPAPNCDMLTSVDADRGFALLTDAISHFSGRN